MPRRWRLTPAGVERAAVQVAPGDNEYPAVKATLGQRLTPQKAKGGKWLTVPGARRQTASGRLR